MIWSLETNAVVGFREHRVNRTRGSGRLRVSSCFQRSFLSESPSTGPREKHCQNAS